MRLSPLLLATALVLTGCSDGDVGGQQDDGRLQVVTGLYPYAWVLERIGGDAVDVRSLATAGAEPHDLELTPQQAAAVAEADLVVRSAGFQPALDDAVAQAPGDRAVDVLQLVETRTYDGEQVAHDDEAEDGHDHGSEDPHLWLDPLRLADVADQLARELAEEADDDRFLAAAQELRAELEALDAQFREGLSGCARSELFTAHDAFGYLADRYGLTQVAVSRSPEQEPSPRRLAEVAEQVRSTGATTVLSESTESTRVVEQLARETGTEVAVLSPLESEPPDGDYLTAMRDNLDVLRRALGCP